jgi:hypothetical protein
VFSSAAVGNIAGNGTQDIVFGSWDYYIYVLNNDGRILAKYYNAETIWSSPALYKLPGRRTDDIFIGNDQTQPGLCVGGFISDFRYRAVAHKHGQLPGELVPVWRRCQGAPRGSARGQSVWSSPAVGILRPGGPPVVVVGTSFYEHPFQNGTNKIYAYDARNGRPMVGWPVTTDGPVLGSPAIGSLDGGADLDVVDTSFVCSTPIARDSEGDCFGADSEVDAFSATGHQLWSDTLLGPTDLGSPILVPLEAHADSAENDVLVGSGDGLFPIEGSTGRFLYGTSNASPARAINPGCQIFNTPAAADVVGTGKYQGWYAFESCDGPSGDGVYAYPLPYMPTAPAAWPMFHHDPAHTGNPTGTA